MIELTIIGKGPDVEKIQKRLNCAARAIKELMLDELKSTEDIKSIFIYLN